MVLKTGAGMDGGCFYDGLLGVVDVTSVLERGRVRFLSVGVRLFFYRCRLSDIGLLLVGYQVKPEKLIIVTISSLLSVAVVRYTTAQPLIS